MPKNIFLKWGAAAGCLLVIACIVATAHPHSGSNPNEPAAHVDGSISPAGSTLELLTHLGLNAEVIENPTNITAGETPYVSREDAVEILKNAELIADCTVEKISRIRILEPDSENVWFITMMTLSRNGTIRGRIEEEQFRVVNAAVTNEPVEFLSTPGLENCREQMQAAFLLKSFGKDDVWTIGETDLAVKDLGDYFAVACMGFDGECIQYGDYSIPILELD